MTFVGYVIDHIRIARIPILMILIGVVLSFSVEQVSELFVLLVQRERVWEVVFAVAASALVMASIWISLRLSFRQTLPGFDGLRNENLRPLRDYWFPHGIGLSVPVTIAVACFQSGAGQYWVPLSFLVAGAVVLCAQLLVDRRLELREVPAPNGLPGPVRLERMLHIVHGCVIAVTLVIALTAAWWPGALASGGTLAVILLSASLGCATGTYISTYGYARGVPLLSILVVFVVVNQAFSLNENHRIRLFAAMDSDEDIQLPDARVDYSAPIARSFKSHVESWRAPGNGPVYLVSAEGGGIRAAAWTTMVLINLELNSRARGGKFSDSYLLGSGVSGGSLGLMLFNAMLRAEQQGHLDSSNFPGFAVTFLESDFLGPVVESLLLAESTQLIVPWPLFIDRGQRMEMAWERAWQRAMAKYGKHRVCATVDGGTPTVEVCHTFALSWKQFWLNHPQLPALFLNSVVAGNGHRFVQHPFSYVSSSSVDDLLLFHGSISAARVLPSSAPVSTVVHNSARFTYVSPAGTLLLPPRQGIAGEQQASVNELQLVDGGYFENSATSTLLELADLVAQSLPDSGCTNKQLSSATCRIHVIHISNDRSVSPLMRGNSDGCDQFAQPRTGAQQGGDRGNMTEQDDVGSRDLVLFKAGSDYADLLAPLLALANTREARGDFARRATSRALRVGADAHAPSRLLHYRLCEGSHPLPLGWTISHNATREMNDQLCGRAVVSRVNGKRHLDNTAYLTGTNSCTEFREGTEQDATVRTAYP